MAGKQSNKLPIEAEIRIMEILENGGSVLVQDALEIIEEHDNEPVDMEKLCRSNNLKRLNRFIASFKDGEGHRLMLSNRKRQMSQKQYVVINMCNDIDELKHIRGTLGREIVGLEETHAVVEKRIGQIDIKGIFGKILPFVRNKWRQEKPANDNNLKNKSSGTSKEKSEL